MIEDDRNSKVPTDSTVPARAPKDTKEATFMLFMQEVEKLAKSFDVTSVLVIPTIVTPGVRGPDVAATMALIVDRKRPNDVLKAATLTTLQVLEPTARQLSVMLTGKDPNVPAEEKKVTLG
jgi:hypothetical protein